MKIDNIKIQSFDPDKQIIIEDVDIRLQRILNNILVENIGTNEEITFCILTNRGVNIQKRELVGSLPFPYFYCLCLLKDRLIIIKISYNTAKEYNIKVDILTLANVDTIASEVNKVGTNIGFSMTNLYEYNIRKFNDTGKIRFSYYEKYHHFIINLSFAHINIKRAGKPGTRKRNS